MINPEDQLQEHLIRIENGEPIEAHLADLPADEAQLLRVAAALRSAAYPKQSAGSIASQRSQLLQAAERRSATTRLSPSTTKPSWLARWTQIMALPKPMKLASVGVLAVAILAGLLLLQSVTPATPNSPQSALTNPGASRYTVYVPAMSRSITVPDPHSAIVADMRGISEMQTSDGRWSRIGIGQVLQAGQRVRTSALSSASLLFYDGSQTQLGASTEVAIEQLDARTNGPRTILLAQLSGETDQDVAPSTNPASRYEVRTPNGTGTAKGTLFHVSVSASLITRISVQEGTVAVTNINVTVLIIAGQVTTIPVGLPPSPPAFQVSGEGVVTQMGAVWRIGGIEFHTDSNTVIIGNPQVGDRVAVNGHLLADGTRVADVIVLLRRAAENRFEFTGPVESIGNTQWTIAGHTVEITHDTSIETGINVGDLVNVDGVIETNGTLRAEHIRLVTPDNGLPFEFTGLVQQIVSGTWTVSGVAIAVDGHTQIESGLGVGDLVKVEGHILPNGTWLADSIRRAEEQEREFEFTGVVQTINPWVVSSISFTTNEQTEIDSGIEVGDRVKVEGHILSDGTWLADEITRLTDQAQPFEFIGQVMHIDPWIVGGISITVNTSTTIESGIVVGDLVRVVGVVQPDGTLLATSITKLNEDVICFDTNAIVDDMQNDEIQLHDGTTLPLGSDTQVQLKVKEGGKTKLKLKGDKHVDRGSVVTVHVCVLRDGTIIVINIIIIRPSEGEPPVVKPPKRTEWCINPAGKVMPCPPGNPPPFRHVGEEDDDEKD